MKGNRDIIVNENFLKKVLNTPSGVWWALAQTWTRKRGGVGQGEAGRQRGLEV